MLPQCRVKCAKVQTDSAFAIQGMYLQMKKHCMLWLKYLQDLIICIFKITRNERQFCNRFCKFCNKII